MREFLVSVVSCVAAGACFGYAAGAELRWAALGAGAGIVFGAAGWADWKNGKL